MYVSQLSMEFVTKESEETTIGCIHLLNFLSFLTCIHVVLIKYQCNFPKFVLFVLLFLYPRFSLQVCKSYCNLCVFGLIQGLLGLATGCMCIGIRE